VCPAGKAPGELVVVSEPSEATALHWYLMFAESPGQEMEAFEPPVTPVTVR